MAFAVAAKKRRNLQGFNLGYSNAPLDELGFDFAVRNGDNEASPAVFGAGLGGRIYLSRSDRNKLQHALGGNVPGKAGSSWSAPLV